MKKLFFVFTSLMCLNLAVVFVNPIKAYAQSGCCKVRDSEDETWLPTGDNYPECEGENNADGDDIYEPTGNVWWDLAC